MSTYVVLHLLVDAVRLSFDQHFSIQAVRNKAYGNCVRLPFWGPHSTSTSCHSTKFNDFQPQFQPGNEVALCVRFGPGRLHLE